MTTPPHANWEWRKVARVIKRFEGPRGIVYACPYCKHSIFNMKPTNWGEAGKAKGELVRHIRANHPEKIKDE